ncbi:hypothetical protein [Bacteroides sp.]|uniref:hypothetical protein n=1 Tax=Bacteroides sp. TaxID=29523 RepID=UPI00262E9ED3|nr:hypothetical protein [Bacteroides sp.]
MDEKKTGKEAPFYTAKELEAKVEECEIIIKQLRDENDQLKGQIEQIKKDKESFSKYWNDSSNECNRVKAQLKAVVTLLDNIK